mmetsp:Transcript_24871/g.65292  ORF Transcript_24871/g.65292 Transcript_24871/m.65292 type:complete len:261 (-) Transcript_24871:100-882(-)
MIPVLEERSRIKEFRRQLRDVLRMRSRRLPCAWDGRKHPIREIKMPSLEFEEHGTERLRPNQILQDRARREVMRTVMKLGDVRVGPCPISILKEFLSLRWLIKTPASFLISCILTSHWLRQVSKSLGAIEINACRGVVSNYPRENGVLGDIIVGSSRKLVDLPKVLEVTDLLSPPSLASLLDVGVSAALSFLDNLAYMIQFADVGFKDSKETFAGMLLFEHKHGRCPASEIHFNGTRAMKITPVMDLVDARQTIGFRVLG